MARFLDLRGTLESLFRIGLSGPALKASTSTKLAVRNATDTAYADIQAALVQAFGNDIELNAGAAGSGADRKMTIRRPSTGMTADVVVVMPADAAPTNGFALAVTNVAAGVITLGYVSIAAGTDQVKTDTTTIAFNAGATTSLFTLPANAVVRKVTVIVDTAFNGAPTLSVGIAGTVSKYLASTQVDLTQPATTTFEVVPGIAAAVSTEALIATYAAGAASAGSARILVDYVIPA